MRSTFLPLILSLLTSQVLCAIVAKPSIDKNVNQENFNLLCKPCEKFFTEVKKYFPDVSTTTKDDLEAVIYNECETLNFIPFLDRVCENFGDWALDKIFDLVVNVDKEIDPTHDCQVIKLC